jgi:hypothetical protein
VFVPAAIVPAFWDEAPTRQDALKLTMMPLLECAILIVYAAPGE